MGIQRDRKAENKETTTFNILVTYRNLGRGLDGIVVQEFS
jgi:hypothetical protein